MNRGHATFIGLFFAMTFLYCTLTHCHGDGIDPRGVYFHSYTGPFSAIEWVDFRAESGQDRYQFSDIRGIAPYQGVIDNTGLITWDNTGSTSGTGQFSDQDNATMTLNYFGGIYNSTLRRAPGTDADFLTQIDSRTGGNLSIAGQWNLAIQDLDASTGQVLGQSSTTAMATVTGDLLRLTFDDGTYYQGVFEEADHAGFRVVLPSSGLPSGFGSFTGSETSLGLNLLGDFRLTSSDAFSATFLTQTRTQPGQQQQFVQVISASRAVPEPGGLMMLTLPVLFAIGRRSRK